MRIEAESTPLSGGAPARGRRGLPLQNLALAAAVMAGVASAACLLNCRTGLPLGRCELGRFPGQEWLGGFPIWLPAVWVAALLSARGTARLLLRPRRQARHYGYWLLGVTAALATWTLAAFDLLATQGMHWWRWTSANWSWEGIALPNLAGSFVVGVLALLLAAPVLIDKRPVPAPPGALPLAVWFGLSVASLAGCVSRASDAAIAVLAAPVLVVTILAFQQHRRAVADCGRSPGGE